MICTTVVVTPSLFVKRRNLTWSANFIYFGHLARWRDKEDDLMELMQRADVLPVLVRQLTTTGEIAWKKHRLLRLSVLLASIGATAMGFALLVA